MLEDGRDSASCPASCLESRRACHLDLNQKQLLSSYNTRTLPVLMFSKNAASPLTSAGSPGSKTLSNESRVSKSSSQSWAVCSCRAVRRGTIEKALTTGSSSLTAMALARPFCVTLRRFAVRVCELAGTNQHFVIQMLLRPHYLPLASVRTIVRVAPVRA